MVVGVCGWTLANTLRFGVVEKQRIDLAELTNPELNITEISNYGNYTHNESGEENRDSRSGVSSSAHWIGMTRRYKMLIQTSITVSLLASLVQLIISIVLLGTSAKVTTANEGNGQEGEMLFQIEKGEHQVIKLFKFQVVPFLFSEHGRPNPVLAIIKFHCDAMPCNVHFGPTVL